MELSLVKNVGVLITVSMSPVQEPLVVASGLKRQLNV